MSTWISLVAFLGTSLAVLFVFVLLTRDNVRSVARVRQLARPSRGRLMEQIRDVLASLPFGTVLLRGNEARLGRLRQRFARAGIYNAHAPSLFLSIRVVLASAGGALAMGLGLTGLLSPLQVLAAGALLPGLGLLLPGLWLDGRTKRWQRALGRGLPDAMDMLVLCLEAGTSLTAALQNVLGDLRLAHPELGAEMEVVQREMMLGKTPGEAMRKFAERCDLEEVRALAGVLLQNERFGVSVSKALRIHADTMRQQRQQRAEEMAQKAAVKILFPTLLCIFPAIFIVILGPAAFQIARLFAR
jgi:tight adherence protein C